MYTLQNRWILKENKLVYYGMRNRQNLFKNTVPVSRRQSDLIKQLPKKLSKKEMHLLRKLIGVQVVQEKDRRSTPKTIEEARFCSECCANDFMIPGLEFNEHGLCPMCQTANKVSTFKSVLPVVNTIPHCSTSDYDAALFYTGGKDSAFLLYYLSKILKLRVFVMTWITPYMSENAVKSIENAKKRLPDAEFLLKEISQTDMQRIYRKLYSLSENTCACPSLAYVLFYPEIVKRHIPYILVGNEPVQMQGLYYNHMAPEFAFKVADSKLFSLAVNIGRIITLRSPLKKGQFQTLATMKQLAFGDNPLKKLTGYNNELVTNVTTAINEVPSLLVPLKKAIRESSETGNIPAFVHIDFDTICNGKYDWKKVKEIIKNECGWVEPEVAGKALHTSCKIEKCKDYSQFNRFYNCKSTMIPFSAIEISLAGRNRNLSRKEAITEIENCLGFSLEKIPECDIMCAFLEKEK